MFTSSIAVYGPSQVPMSEEMVPKPEDPFGIAKYAVELDLSAAQRMFDLDYTIFRPHNVYGERQNIADKYRNVIGIQRLKEQVLWIERFETLEELRVAVRSFGRLYNREWLLERHGYRTPIEAREHLLAQAVA